MPAAFILLLGRDGGCFGKKAAQTVKGRVDYQLLRKVHFLQKRVGKTVIACVCFAVGIAVYDLSLIHIYFVCSECNQVYDMELGAMEDLNKEAQEHAPGIIDSHYVLFYGRCNSCLQKKVDKAIDKPA